MGNPRCGLTVGGGIAETKRGLLPLETHSSGASALRDARVTAKPAPRTLVWEGSFALALINGVSHERHCLDGRVSRGAEPGLAKSP